jgi:hypothetical protein
METPTREDLTDLLSHLSDARFWLQGQPDVGGAIDAVDHCIGRLEGWLETDDVPLDEIESAPARNTDPATSHHAWKDLTARGARGKLAVAFYKAHHIYGSKGLTPEQACRSAKIEGQSSPWKRVSDLKAAGIIEPTGKTVVGKRGREQEVLTITPHGSREVERTMRDEVAKFRNMADVL